ncbi:MAG TPA: ABC transporter permease [Myxococcales bacterium]|nr:ABC transporter permease [Myxococcales bacterium]
MDAVLRDLRTAVRMLLRTPGVSAAAVLALALGIGATTGIFSVVNAVLLRSLGWGEESRLVAVRGNFEAQNLIGIWVSVPEYQDLRTAAFFHDVGVYYGYTAALQGKDRAERVSVGYATGSFFDALGVRPVYGRNFTVEEDRKGQDDVALLSWAAWQKRYGSDPSVVGQTVTLEGRPRTIVGILPASFLWEQPHEFYLPFGFTPEALQQRGSRSLDAVARLAPGVSFAAASREIAQFSADVRKANPDWYHPSGGWHLTLTPLRDRFVGSARQPLLLLFGAVFLVLLIACANVANLMLARGAARSREIAVRSALGAPRGRLVRQLLTESALLAACGTVCGVLFSAWSLDLMLAAAPAAIRHLTDVRLDRAVLGFAAALTALTTILFGLAPALHATRSNLVDALKDGGPGTAGPSRGRLRRALVVGQFALSLMLLAGAGLLLRSFAEVLRVRPGFDPSGVLSARVTLGGSAYEGDEARVRYWSEAVRRISALPGVDSAGAIGGAPLEGIGDWSYDIEGYEPKPGESPDDQLRQVTPGYFRAMRIPIRQGRDLSETDDAKAPLVILVNEAWVRRFFPGQDVIGRRIRLGDKRGKPRSIAGVVGDSHDLGLEAPTPPMLFVPQAQLATPRMTLMVRAQGGQPEALAQSVQAALMDLDRSQPADWVAPFEQRIAGALAPRRFPLQLLGVFAALALVLSALGIYSVTAYGVTQRTREIGVRIAIGALQRDVLRMVMWGALKLAAAGVALGLCGAMAGARLLSSQLYGVGSRDPLTYAAISGLLTAVALVASWLPARRATRVDPVIALRTE